VPGENLEANHGQPNEEGTAAASTTT